MNAGWPEFDRLLTTLGFVPSRTGSVISTIYGDAILPRGGSLALADLLVLMRRLGASDGVVRTAVSRLARDGVLVGRRTGRTSAYALSERGRAEFTAAVPVIYGRLGQEWDGRLHVAFPTEASDRIKLEDTGFATVTPGVLIGFDACAGVGTLHATGDTAYIRDLCARAWPSQEMDEYFRAFVQQFNSITTLVAPTPLDATAARIVLIHAYRRLALRAARLPASLRDEAWPGFDARRCCERLYRQWAPTAEAWLDQASGGSGPLPRGPDPLERFSGGDR